LPGVSFMRILLRTNEDECLEVPIIVNQCLRKAAFGIALTWRGFRV